MRNRIGSLWVSQLQYLHAVRIPPCALPLFERRCIIVLLRCAVLASSILLMLPGAWGHSATVVEFAHLPAGLAAWQQHSLGIYRVCGPVSKLLYSLPAHLAGVRVDYPESFDSDVQSRREWELGQIFQQQNCKNYHNIYRWSRLLPILVTVLGGYIICEWSTSLFGNWPGLVSLCVWCWMPPILAHGSLVTSDIFSAVVLVLAARTFSVFLLKPVPATAFLAGLMLGIAQATKYTLLILYPSWTILLIARAIQLRSTGTLQTREGHSSPAQLFALGTAVLVISIVVIDALYLLQGIGCRPEQLHPLFSSSLRDIGLLSERPVTAWLLKIPLPIPREFLLGLDFQLADTERLQSAYLLGRIRLGGWWYWYIAAALFKMPLSVLAMFAFALYRSPGIMSERGPILWAGLCLLIPAAEVAWVISATTGAGTNAAFRYMTPSLALLCVWLGFALRSCSKVTRTALAGFLAWLAVNAMTALPDHLGWQNELGTAWSRWNRRPAVIGDSLDWGQDLARLGEWATYHSSEGGTVICVYGFGKSEPYGLRPPMARPTSAQHSQCAYLAVSEQMLFGDYITNSVAVDGGESVLSRPQRETLLHRRPIEWVGRTIRIYRLRDLVPDVEFSASTQASSFGISP